jgi:SagB-type dehydrogenase family enzyme
MLCFSSKSLLHCVIILLCVAFLSVPFIGLGSASGLSLEETMSRRMSSRSFTSQDVPNQQLLDVLWAAYGSVGNLRTVPEIGSGYPLIILSVNSTGSYKYDPENNVLSVNDLTIKKETISNDFLSNTWVNDASAILIVMWDHSVSNNQYFASAQAGCLVQNVYLAAASLNLGTCCVDTINFEALQTHLKLSGSMTPLLIMPLSYPSSSYPQASPNYAVMTGNLPQVQYGALSFEEALRNIPTAQESTVDSLTSQQLSQLLWASYGYTSVMFDSSYHRTTPSAYGIYPLVVFVSNATGVYRYEPEAHSVSEILQTDQRSAIADALSGQQWAASASTLLLVTYDSSFNNGDTGDGGNLDHLNIEVDTGTVVQQIVLEASALNLRSDVLYQGLESWNGAQAAVIRNIIGASSSIVPLYVVSVGVANHAAIPEIWVVPFLFLMIIALAVVVSVRIWRNRKFRVTLH